MPLQIKPHTITVRQSSQPVGSNSVLLNPTINPSQQTVRCLCVPLKPQESIQKFGVTLVDAWMVMIDPADASSISPHSSIDFNGDRYSVKGDVERHLNSDIADCVIFTIVRQPFEESP